MRRTLRLREASVTRAKTAKGNQPYASIYDGKYRLERFLMTEHCPKRKRRLLSPPPRIWTIICRLRRLLTLRFVTGSYAKLADRPRRARVDRANLVRPRAD